MDFLKKCASRLDAGEAAESVLLSMKERFSTSRCMNVKTCLVRSMCTPSEEYTSALESACASHPEWEDLLRSGKCDGKEGVREVLSSLPHRLPANVRSLRVTRSEMAECKRLSARSALKKNMIRTKVDGRRLLSHARGVLLAARESSLSELALSLMLLTGRRTCEILNGRSVFAEVDGRGERALRFCGQAKRRKGVNGREEGGTEETVILIPVLAPPSHILEAIRVMRVRQGGVRLRNDATSRRYQSLLARHIQGSDTWRECKKVHGLRGVYTCMSLRLFKWNQDLTDSLVAMCILGHTRLTDSLVYMTFHLGDDFWEEEMLGEGMLTEPLVHPEP